MLTIKKERLLDWFTGLAYAFNDVDLDYHSEESEESVKAVFDSIGAFLKESGIDIKSELEKRNSIADTEP